MLFPPVATQPVEHRTAHGLQHPKWLLLEFLQGKLTLAAEGQA